MKRRTRERIFKHTTRLVVGVACIMIAAFLYLMLYIVITDLPYIFIGSVGTSYLVGYAFTKYAESDKE